MSYPVDDRRVESDPRTEVRAAKDGQFFYIGTICYGPEEYVIKTLKRDAEFWDGDGFGVVLDPVNEKTNGFTFGISPAGVQTEYLVTGDASRRDNLNINSRFQWRFQPMSDLYIVYTDNYAVEFWGPKNRALVIKLNYWFNL
jgi:hypothetical protein